jgi:hypothetical protein
MPSQTKKWKIKYGRIDNQIRNKFPYWSFSNFVIEFELKIREHQEPNLNEFDF